MDYPLTNPRCALCGVPACRYVKEQSISHKIRSVPVERMEDVVILTRDPATETIFLLKEPKITFTSSHQYDISAKPEPHEGLFPGGKVKVYDGTVQTNALSFPLHRSCYELFVELAPGDLHNCVLSRVLYKALHGHFLSRIVNDTSEGKLVAMGAYLMGCELKEPMPVDIQLQHDFDGDRFNGPYGLNNQDFGQKSNEVFDFAFSDPYNISSEECERIVQDVAKTGDHWLRNHKVPKKLQKDENGNKLSWATGWFPKKSTKAVPNWYRFYETMDFAGKFGQPMVQDSKKVMNRYRVAVLCGKVFQEGCEITISLVPTEAELALENKSGKKAYAKSSKLDPTKAEFVPGQSKTDDALTDAFPGYMLELAWFDPKVPSTSGAIGFLQQLDNVVDAQPAIKVSWTDEMVLAGIGIAYKLGETENVIGSPETFHTAELVVIPKNDWLCGLTFTTCESPEFENGPLHRRIVGIEFHFFEAKTVVIGNMSGEKRAIVHTSDSFIVGLVGVWSPGESLRMVGLLQQPLDKAPTEASAHRLNPDVRSPEQESSVTDPEAANFLWANEVPRGGLQVSPCHPPQSDPHLTTDILLFNSDTIECHGVNKIGIDPQLRFFQVYFYPRRGGKIRSMGRPSQAIQYFSFQTGEVIVQCYITGVKRVEGLRFTTTHGRQYIIGKDGPNAKPLVDKDKGQCVMGFYGTWRSRDFLDETLVSFGVLTRDGLIPLEYPLKDTEVDSHKYPWCPTGPAYEPSMQEIDPIYGTITTPTQTRVAWLDCSKPFRTVQVTFCHRRKGPGLPIVSIIHHFVDNSTPSEFGPTYVRKGQPGVRSYCHCDDEDTEMTDMLNGPHYRTHTWEVGGFRLQSVHLWLDEEGFLKGLQYTANGHLGPFWGNCNPLPSVELELQYTNERGPVLKFFLCSDERNKYGVDFVVAAVQLLDIEIRHERKTGRRWVDPETYMQQNLARNRMQQDQQLGTLMLGLELSLERSMELMRNAGLLRDNGSF